MVESDREKKKTIPAKPLKRPDPTQEEEKEQNEEEEEMRTPRPLKAQWVSDGPTKSKRLVGMVAVPFVRLRTKTSTDSLLEGVADSMKGQYSPPSPRRQSSSSTPPSSKLLILISLLLLLLFACVCGNIY